jgi:RimJ/RimL family protein N-acetyltransferase
MLTSRDAHWMVEVDQAGGAHAHRLGWDERPLPQELAADHWATDARWGWAIVVDGEPGGFALVTGLDGTDADLDIRISPRLRGRGVGREVLRQLADHHFAEHPNVRRLVGRTHEQNVPMQRALNAAGFRMEARYRETYQHPDGRYASEWGYALTRADWEAGRHHADDHGYDLHGITFVVDQVLEGDDRTETGLVFKFLQEGRRALARYAGGDIHEGELAGILTDDVIRYHYVHEADRSDGTEVVTGRGTARVQRRQDGRLEVVNDWADDSGQNGKTFLVERSER